MQMFQTVRRSALALCLAAFAAVAVAQTAPDVLVKNVSQEVLGIIKSDPKVQAGDQARIRERQARRAASGKPVHPLPAPPQGAASAAR